ncbi:MAG: hypothetical protein NTW74_20975 [Acidobacteria bacterium]|nr:hypothetical protein [Acidobacteriota bacterium]
MKSSPLIVGLGLVASFAFGQVVPTGVSIAISNEIVPASSVAQVKVMLTEPKPIIRTGMKAAFDESFFDEFLGLSAAGGLTGVGVIDRGTLRLELSTLTPDAYVTGYPLVTIAVKTKPGLPVGYQVPVSLDLASSSWLDPTGTPFAKEVKPGSVTIGGTQFISNVVPGGGMLKAGDSFLVMGGGFTKDEKGRAEGARLKSVRPNELQFEVKAAMKLDGTRIVVDNGAREQTTYYAYPRGLKTAPSTNAALRGVVPVFSNGATLEAKAGLSGSMSSVVGIGLQNPTRGGVTIELECDDVIGSAAGTAKISLGPGEVVFRSYAELFGAAMPVGSYSIKAKAKSAFQIVLAEFEGGAIRVANIVPVSPAFY